MNRTPVEYLPQILVVDDTPENLQVVGEMLSRQLSCDLSFATDGRQALESVKETPPDLILLDVMMPGMTGYDVCRALKANPATAGIPVLFLTAKVESADVVEGFEAGAVDYIAKPFNPSEMVARVKTQLRIRQAEAERMKFEAQTRQLQKSESLGRMAGAIAHNFNNQLQAVLGNLELAMADLPPEAAVQENLKSALQAGRRAAEMSGLMLTYLGQSAAGQERVDLAGICREAAEVFPRTLPGGVVWKMAGLPGGMVIKAAASQIRQMLDHLLTNAREAIGAGPGVIQLELRTATAAEIPERGRFPPEWEPLDCAYACLEVEDTGGGIAAKDFDQIFDPFFTTKFTGRGLGLPVVQGIVRSHGGGVAVESQPGRGSVFRVYLPLPSVPARPVAREAGGVAGPAGDETILLVEDEGEIRRVAAAMLKRLGYSVLEAPDGEAAVALFRENAEKIRCVVCDLSMPKMDGWETLVALRRRVSGLPVVLASGYDQAHVMTGEHDEWPQAFLHKPFQMVKLQEAICQAMGRAGNSEGVGG